MSDEQTMHRQGLGAMRRTDRQTFSPCPIAKLSPLTGSPPAHRQSKRCNSVKGECGQAVCLWHYETHTQWVGSRWPDSCYLMLNDEFVMSSNYTFCYTSHAHTHVCIAPSPRPCSSPSKTMAMRRIARPLPQPQRQDAPVKMAPLSAKPIAARRKI